MLEELVRRFGEQWDRHRVNPQDEPAPKLLDYLPGENQLAEKVFWVLANYDLRFRLQHVHGDEAPRVEDYLALPRANGITEDSLVELLRTEFTERLPREAHLTPEAYVQRFPSIAGKIRRRLALVAEPVPDIPGYPLLGVLGRGGMGVVYEAWDQAVQRMVALKIIGPAASLDGRLHELFRREIDYLKKVQHPNIVPLYDSGVHAGLPYYSMRFLEGDSLASWVERGLPVGPAHKSQNGRAYCEATVRLFLKVCRAIEHAHRCGVVHRDLKPANILLDEQDVPYVADFGLACGQSALGLLSSLGRQLGTPMFMAPEQVQGKPATCATDVYGLGVILYFLLTGRPPLEGQTHAEVHEKVLKQDPIPPRRLQHWVPRDLEAICRACLRKDPGARYQATGVLIEDLELWQRGEPIKGRPVRWDEQLVRTIRRHPLAISAMATAFVFSLVLIGLQWRANQALDRSWHQENLARARAESYLHLSSFTSAWLSWQANDPAGVEAQLERCPSERRGWEWHYLKSRLRPELRTLNGHEDARITIVAYSADGKRLFSGGGGSAAFAGYEKAGQILSWDPENGALLRRLTGHATPIVSLALRPDGRLLGSSELDGSVRWWDPLTGKACPSRENMRGAVRALTFSPDGRRLAWAADGEGVRIRAQGNSQHELICPDCLDMCRQLVFDPSGRHLASNGAANLYFWDADTGQLLWRRPTGTSAMGLAFSPDGRLLAVAHGVSAVLLQADNGQQVQQIIGHDAEVRALTFTPDGRFLVTSANDRTIRMWNVKSGEVHLKLRGPLGSVEGVSIHPDGWQMATCEQAPVPFKPGLVRIWDQTAHPEYSNFDGLASSEDDDSEGLAFTGDSQNLLLVRRGGLLQTRAASSGRALTEHLHDCASRILGLRELTAFTPDGRRLAGVARDERLIKLWDPASGQLLRVLRGHAEPVWHLAMSGTGTMVASAGPFHSGTAPDTPWELFLWDAENGIPLFNWRAPQGPIGQLALSPNGQWLAVAMPGHPGEQAPQIWLCETAVLAATGRLVVHHVLDGPDHLQALAFSPDGRWLASGGGLGHTLLWDLNQSGAAPAVLNGPPGLGALGFSPDSRRLAAVNRDSEVYLWDVTTAEKLLDLRGGPPRPWKRGFNPKLAWSPDGDRLAINNWDYSITVWDALPGASAERVFAWHLRQAAQALQMQEEFAVGFHVQRLRAAKPPDMPSRLLRADLLARLGNLTEALADYQQLEEDPVRGPESGWRAAVVLMEQGKVDAYRALCRRQLARFGTAEDDLVRRTLARTCMLAPPEADVARWLGSWLEDDLKRLHVTTLDWRVRAVVAYRLGLFELSRQAGDQMLREPVNASPSPFHDAVAVRLGRPSEHRIPNWREAHQVSGCSWAHCQEFILLAREAQGE